MERSSGSGQSGTNGGGLRGPSSEPSPLLGGITRQDLDHLFDEPSHPAIPRKQQPRAIPREAETLFEDKDAVGLFDDDEVASLFEDTTTDSVPRALVPSRLKSATRVLVKPLPACRASSAAPHEASPSFPPQHGSKRWPALKPALGQSPAIVQAGAPSPAVKIDAEDAPTIPTLPPLPHLPDAGPRPAAARPTTPAPAQPRLDVIDPEDQDTEPDLPLIPVPTPREPHRAPVLVDAPPVREVELALEPEPALPAVDVVPPPLLDPEVEAPAAATTPPAQAAEPVPLVMTRTNTPARHFVEYEPTLEVRLPETGRSSAVIMTIGAFAAGAALASMLLLLLPAQGVPASQPAMASLPDPVQEPVATPLTEPPMLRVVAMPLPVPVGSAAPAARLPLARRVALAGDRAAEMILPCLTDKNRRYQKVAVHLTPAGTIRRAFIGQSPWANEQNSQCMRRMLEWQDLKLKGVPGSFVEWHLFMGETPVRAQLSRPKELRGKL